MHDAVLLDGASSTKPPTPPTAVPVGSPAAIPLAEAAGRNSDAIVSFGGAQLATDDFATHDGSHDDMPVLYADGQFSLLAVEPLAAAHTDTSMRRSVVSAESMALCSSDGIASPYVAKVPPLSPDTFEEAPPPQLAACKWDGPTIGEAAGGNMDWADVLRDVPMLWAIQLAPESIDSSQRALVGTRSLLRDFRYTFLAIKYGTRLPCFAASLSSTVAATRALQTIIAPATEDGRRRRARAACVVTPWVDTLMRHGTQDTVAAEVVAATWVRVWSRIVQPVVPAWTVAVCVREYFTSVFKSLDTRIKRASVSMVLFELVDVLCVSRLEVELTACVASAMRACAEEPALADERAWLACAPMLVAPADDMSAAWAWCLRHTLGTPDGAEEELWVTCPPPISDEYDALAVETNGTGLHSVTVDVATVLGAACPTAAADRVLLLTDEVNLDAMTLCRDGVGLALRRSAPPSSSAVLAVASGGNDSRLTETSRRAGSQSQVDVADTASSDEDDGVDMGAIEALAHDVPKKDDIASVMASSTGHNPAADATDTADEQLDWGAGAADSAAACDGDDATAVAPWHTRLNFANRRLLLESAQDAPNVVRAADGMAMPHLASCVIAQDDLFACEVPAPPSAPAALAKPLRIALAKLADDGMHPSAHDVAIRYVDDYCDAMLSCSVPTLFKLASDESRSARGLMVFSTLDPDAALERTDMELFDREADDESDEEPEARPARRHAQPVEPAATAPRSYSFDVFASAAPFVDRLLRSRVLRNGAVPLVRRLVALLRDAISSGAIAQPLLRRGVCPNEGHASVYVVVPPHIGGSLQVTSETTGLARAAPQRSIDRALNPLAALQAHNRSASPAFVGNACRSGPLGGSRARPAQARRPARRADLAIPEAVPPPCGFAQHRQRPVSESPFGFMRARSRLQRALDESAVAESPAAARSVTPGDDIVLRSSSPTKRDERPAAERSASPVQRSFAPPVVVREMGTHPRHPGATAEWASLQALQHRARSLTPGGAASRKARELLRRHRGPMVRDVPICHELHPDAVTNCIDAVAVAPDRVETSSRFRRRNVRMSRDLANKLASESRDQRRVADDAQQQTPLRIMHRQTQSPALAFTAK